MRWRRRVRAPGARRASRTAPTGSTTCGAHADGNLAFWLPAARVPCQGDLFDMPERGGVRPAFVVTDALAAVVAIVRAGRLRVEHAIGLRGRGVARQARRADGAALALGCRGAVGATGTSKPPAGRPGIVPGPVPSTRPLEALLPRHALAPLALVALLACSVARGAPAAAATPHASASVAAADSLLAADRAFASDAASLGLVDALPRMFADDVLMLAPGGRIARGRDSAAAVLRANPLSAGARAGWTPVRAGVSADARHGFTIGYATIALADGRALPMKYVAYWVREAGGWRVAAYKRVPRPAGAVDTAPRAPSLPPGASIAGDVREHAASLQAAELAFSDAARAGLGPAFRANAAPDATHTGGPQDAAFLVGPDAIASGVSAGGDGPTDIRWSATHTVVAASGDLGVNVGFIHFGSNPPVPFLTVWRRDGPGRPWRFVAE